MQSVRKVGQRNGYLEEMNDPDRLAYGPELGLHEIPIKPPGIRVPSMDLVSLHGSRGNKDHSCQVDWCQFRLYSQFSGVSASKRKGPRSGKG